MRARHRLAKFLLRRERHYPGRGHAWAHPHRRWLSYQRFQDRPSQLTFEDYLHAHEVLLVRRERIEQELGQVASESAWAPAIGRLRCLRGIDTLSALGLCAEIGDFLRFDHPDRLASYLGLVPSENSSGDKRRQGWITKAGSSHARRLLIEATYHYRHHPAVGMTLERRQPGQRPQVIDLRLGHPEAPERTLAAAQAPAWQAQRDRRRRRGARAGGRLLGGRPARLTTTRLTCRGARGGPGSRTNRSVRERPVSTHPSSGGRARSQTADGATNKVLG
jgi:transposase